MKNLLRSQLLHSVPEVRDRLIESILDTLTQEQAEALLDESSRFVATNSYQLNEAIEYRLHNDEWISARILGFNPMMQYCFYIGTVAGPRWVRYYEIRKVQK
jgi:hypothetical protein